MITPEEKVKWYMAQYKLNKSEAVKMAAKNYGIGERTLYRYLTNRAIVDIDDKLYKRIS